MQKLNPQEPDFLVRINEDYFLQSVSGQNLQGTDVPSAAMHMNYRQADTICARLRVRGYRGAYVTGPEGIPIRPGMLVIPTPAPKTQTRVDGN